MIAKNLSPTSIGIDEHTVCFINAKDGGIYVLPKDGGSITLVGRGDPGTLGGVSCGGDRIYWSSMGKVYRAPASGGPVELVFEKRSRIDGLASDGSGVFIGWGSVGIPQAEGQPGGIVYVAKGTTTPVTLAEGVGVRPEKLALDGGEIYFSNWEARGIRKVSQHGGPVTTLVEDAGYTPDEISVNATDVYFLSGFDHKIRSVPKAGGPVRVLPTADLMVESVSADDQAVYFTASKASNTEELYRLEKDRLEPAYQSVMANGQIRGDETAIYSASGSLGAIVRFRKPPAKSP